MAKFNPFRKLEQDEPFTDRELNRYSTQKLNFIRGIQLSENLNKKDAIMESDKYFLLPEKERKDFSESVRLAIEREYPEGLRKKFSRRSGKYTRVSQPVELPTREEALGEESFSKKFTRDEVYRRIEQQELQNEKYYSDSVFKRMKANMNKHPDDSLKQWQKGHNTGRR